MKRILSTLVTISLLFGVTAAEAEGKVTIDGTSVILHCPQIFKADSISWYKIDKDGNEKVEGGNGYEFTILDYSESDDGGYGCKDAASKYKFYIKVKDYRHEQLGAQNVPLGRGPNIAASHQQSEYAPIKSGQRDLYDKLQR
ncbi:TYRO protein tyrosine kinase-binding protein isoform X2 [Scyliorhinus canicula]|uniref:TYRO protein tyrosine kinase-binding protein isoform X2 n=1 Tax=Scyliorhinus canicula TaxID=7830 RepID=UPI0018F63772|nr:TYRO protein tyrosine kinase-binding protein isoform X2 [Scyliorhinus canicula]